MLFLGIDQGNGNSSALKKFPLVFVLHLVVFFNEIRVIGFKNTVL